MLRKFALQRRTLLILTAIGIHTEIIQPIAGQNTALLRTLSNPTPEAEDEFGVSLAISKDFILVGAPRDRINGIKAGSVHLFEASTGVFIRTISNPTPEEGDYFGFSVAIDDENIVIGDASDNSKVKNAGQAYIFDVSGALLRTLKNPTPKEDGNFGGSVSISHNSVFVGTSQQGCVYVFDAISGSLSKTIKVADSDNHYFPLRIAISDAYLVVGAPLDNTVAANSGSAYLFGLKNGSLLRKLHKPDPRRDEFFSSMVEISGNDILVGAPGQKAFLFNAETGAVLTIFNNPAPTKEDAFAASGAISKSWVVLGASRSDTGRTKPGTTYLFDLRSGSLLQTLNNPTPAEHDSFGASVALRDDIVVVGAPGDDTQVNNSGSVYVFSCPDSPNKTRRAANPNKISPSMR